MAKSSFEEAAAFGLSGGELHFQPFAQGHQLVAFGDDAVLLSEWREWDKNGVKNFKVDIFPAPSPGRMRASRAFTVRMNTQNTWLCHGEAEYPFPM